MSSGTPSDASPAPGSERPGSASRRAGAKTGGAGDPPIARCLHNRQLDDAQRHLDQHEFFWLDLADPSDGELVRLGKMLNLHPLTIDDAKHFHERPKLDEYDGYDYLVVYGVDPDADSGTHLLREVHLVISGDCVVSLHRGGGFQTLAELRQRYHEQPMRSEQFLLYKLLDAITATFIPVLTRIDDDIDEIEEAVIATAEEQSLKRIFSLKRDLVAMRRVVTPMRDVFARDAERIADLPGLQSDDTLYFRDLYDSLIRVSDLIDSYRDLLSGATDMYLSTVANRQGEISKQLTIIATIFLPLSFLTGFFGQNFSFLTNHIIDNTWTFFALGLGSLVVSIALLMVFFRRRRWI